MRVYGWLGVGLVKCEELLGEYCCGEVIDMDVICEKLLLLQVDEVGNDNVEVVVLKKVVFSLGVFRN